LAAWLTAWFAGSPPHNVWMGTSIESQTYLRPRLDALLTLPAARYFFSLEPLLGPLDFDLADVDTSRIDWMIVGGESGLRTAAIRPMHPDWALAIRDYCQRRQIAFFFKQLGEYSDADADGVPLSLDRALPPGSVWVHPDGTLADLHTTPPSGAVIMRRAGKHHAGRLLATAHYSDSPLSVPLPSAFSFHPTPSPHDSFSPRSEP
jgi:Protein of unknown function (DUF5131)